MKRIPIPEGLPPQESRTYYLLRNKILTPSQLEQALRAPLTLQQKRGLAEETQRLYKAGQYLYYLTPSERIPAQALKDAAQETLSSYGIQIRKAG